MVLLVTSVGGCQGIKPFEGDEASFKIDMPAKWVVDREGGSYVLSAPKDSSTVGVATTLVEERGRRRSAQEVAEAVKQVLETLPSVELKTMETRQITIADGIHQAYFFDLTFKVKDREYRRQHWVFDANPRRIGSYWMTAPVGDFASLLGTGTTMLSTLAVGEAASPREERWRRSMGISRTEKPSPNAVAQPGAGG
jgi:hypothetical protein